jgi:DNA sulfur modification protein DndD
MFIRKINFHNYRIYKGYNEVCFQPDKDKNVFIIAGNNGYGKTTFLTSLVWCLYGKHMAEVDTKYKKDISDAGGYKNFLVSNLNKSSKLEADNIKLHSLNTGQTDIKEVISDEERLLYENLYTYSVSLNIDQLSIPSVPCNNVTITRSYSLYNNKEKIEILIDGFKNELTNEVGPEIFINDFILPKEIAKFFFFDAETIVYLAELKSNEEKRNLSKAYTEVLGIKKYEDLKENLENLRIRFRRKSATLEEKDKLTILQKELLDLQKVNNLQKDEISRNDEELKNKRFLSSQYQEKLIREGNTLSLDELETQKKLRDKLIVEGQAIKARLKDLMELMPFAIAGNLLQATYSQALLEKKNTDHFISSEVYLSKLSNLHSAILESVKNIVKDNNTSEILNSEIEKAFNTLQETSEIKTELVKTILAFSETEHNEFLAIYDNIKFSFSQVFQTLVKEERNNRLFLSKVIKKITQAESNENDLLIRKIRQEKDKIEKQIQDLEKLNRKLIEDLGGYHKEMATKAKVIAELSKKVSLNDYDQKKDSITQELIRKLTNLLVTLKKRKKDSLELRIKNELNKLFHKVDFIASVEVSISEDYLDIHLYDTNQKIINKESLSKGEQQLYASSILKALVDESGIEFPIFIDSPLQKLDNTHSRNVICDFYPSISSQVVILPLLYKELTEVEYFELQPKVNQVFLINNSKNKSCFKSINPSELFSTSIQIQ